MVNRLFYSIYFKEPMDTVVGSSVALLRLEDVGLERGVSQELLRQLGMEMERHKWISFPVVKLQKISFR